jgi:hypothetical protein
MKKLLEIFQDQANLNAHSNFAAKLKIEGWTFLPADLLTDLTDLDL